MDGQITAAVGYNGAGKTLCIVDRVIRPSLDAGRPVLSNTPIFAGPDDAHLPWQQRAPHPLYVPLLSWRQLSSPLHGVTIFLDEISSMFDSRDSGRMPTQITSRFNQLRKADNLVCWTAPDWDRCDKVLRRVTRRLWYCKGYLPQAAVGPDGEPLVWKSNRLFRWKFYDAQKFEEFSTSQADSSRKGTLRSDDARWHRRSRHQSQFLYDTYAEVNLLDHLDETGKCVDCGGTRRALKCECPPARNAGVVQERWDLDRMQAFAAELLLARTVTS
ncbi:MAG TPA: hypothetical protein VNQ33_07710 [Acidimicrobiales bacterium]|nr:hypothetical protein [Acidimicrobiales bacterium]